MHIRNLALFVATIPSLFAQNNIIWNIPKTASNAGEPVSISAAFLDALPTTLFSIFIVNSSGDFIDVVAVNQTGSGAAGIWNIPANFPSGTYQVQITDSTTSYTAPSPITVSAIPSLSNCAFASFRTQSPQNFDPISIYTPKAGSLVGLPPVDSTKPGEFNVEYLWKVDNAESGWRGVSALYIDVLAIPDAKQLAQNQIPTATFAHTTVLPPTVSAKVMPIVIPTVSVVKNFLGPAAVRINYTIAGTTKSVFSYPFFLGRSCTGKSIGEGNSNSTFTSPGSNAGITVKADDSKFVGIIIGVAGAAIVVTVLVVLGILWLLKRRRARRAAADKY